MLFKKKKTEVIKENSVKTKTHNLLLLMTV